MSVLTSSFLVLVFILYFEPVGCLRCFKCAYSKNGKTITFPACGDPFIYNQNSVPLNCATGCYKLVLNSGEDSEQIERGCWDSAMQAKYQSTACAEASFDDYGYLGSVSCCDEFDMCNSANILTTTTKSTPTILALTLLIWTTLFMW